MNYRSKYTGAEIEAALDKIINNVTDNDELATIIGNVNKRFDNYLPTSGGMLSGTSADILTINRRDSDSPTTIVYNKNGNLLGRMGFDTSGNPVAQIGGAYYNIITSAGGTITSSSHIPLVVESTASNNYVAIRLKSASTQRTLGIKPDGTLFVTNVGSWDSEYPILHVGNYSDLITTLNGNLSVGGNVTLGKDKYLHLTNTSNKVVDALRIHTNNVLYVGYGSYQEKQDTWLWGKNIKFIYGEQGMSAMTIDENGDIHISKNLIVDGEVSAGGAGEEGSDDMGLALLENWADYDATKAQALGAVLGKDMYDRVVTLEGKSTNVQFTPTLASGKQIGAITIDGVTTGIFAPSSYAWSEITSKPTTLAGYGITDAIKVDGSTPLVGSLTISSASDKKIVLNNTDKDDKYQFISFCQNGVEYGSLGTSGDASLKWNNNTLIHSGNVGEYAVKYLGGSKADDARHSLGLDNGSQGSVNLPEGGGYISFGHNSYGGQLLGGFATGKLYFRTLANNAWSDWKTIAFTDSTVEAAHKLVTPSNLVFADVNGNNVLLGYETGQNGYDTIVAGKSITIRVFSNQSSSVDAMFVNTSGNVTLGNSNLAGSDYKLYVNGESFFTTNKNSYKLYTRIEQSGVQVGRTTANYNGGYNGGLSYGENGTILGYIAGVYNINVDTEKATYFFYGGPRDSAAIYVVNSNVGIGTNPSSVGAKLQVAGDISMNGTSLTGKLTELEQRLVALGG